MKQHDEDVITSVVSDIPRTVYFYATSFCNSDCAYCIFRKSNAELPRRDFKFDDLISVWSNSRYLPKCGVVLQGGEFTMHPDALRIAKFIKFNSRKVTLLTNMIKPELIPPYYPYIDQLTISLDGPNHDRSRGSPGNLDSIIYFFDDFAPDGTGLPINLQITLGPWNLSYTHVGWFLDFAETHHAGVRVNLALPSGLLGRGNYSHNLSEIKEVAKLLSSRGYNAQAKYVLQAAVGAMGARLPCFSTSTYSTLMENGDVLICQGLPYDEAKIGNVLTEPFDKIWDRAGEQRLKLRTCSKCVLSCQLLGDISYMEARAKRGA